MSADARLREAAEARERAEERLADFESRPVGSDFDTHEEWLAEHDHRIHDRAVAVAALRLALRDTESAGVLDRVLAERDAWKTLHDAKSGPYNYGNQEHLRIIRRARVLLSALSLRDALDTETTE